MVLRARAIVNTALSCIEVALMRRTENDRSLTDLLHQVFTIVQIP
ncbi:hypothetical protein EV644_11531 [Kribbella orskensis]|uniref:TetR family transcriptional regulator n=1 Tax=Kribbella orskensis TaxID=2512216 RepID=A0ABY2BG84_9ACTN|nr:MULTISPECIES: hypothetical protein [Kribbella]TCN35469.1 hypothetical protein EV642_11631 [Kribbella sp. VKM Ac-2500]TCO17011.1 hypothetical protein EV644_11531 [Kribbella orskensis]